MIGGRGQVNAAHPTNSSFPILYFSAESGPDSPLHKDGQNEGVAGGDTKSGIKPCLHSLLAVLAEVRVVARLRLLPGNAHSGDTSGAAVPPLAFRERAY